MIYFPLIIVVLVISFFLQEFCPVLEWAYHAKLLLVQTVFYCVAITVPYPVMLLLALGTGFLWDARYHIPVFPPGSSHAELPFGFTIFLFGLMGSMIQGVRPLFRRGRWELPVIIIGVCTFAGLVIEYLVISFHRGGLDLSPELWFMMLMTSLFSMAAAPFILLLLSWMANKTGYRFRLDGVTRGFRYGDSF